MTDWNAIIREYGSLVWKTVYRLLNHEADAADCFQRTFLAAVELAAADTVRNWPGLLKRLATARALEQLRTRYRPGAQAVRLPEEPLPNRLETSPLELAEAGELAAALRTALTEIDSSQAEVFCLICLEGQSYTEAAKVLGVTANHVGVLLTRGRTALRSRLQAFEPDRQLHPGGRS